MRKVVLYPKPYKPFIFSINRTLSISTFTIPAETQNFDYNYEAKIFEFDNLTSTYNSQGSIQITGLVDDDTYYYVHIRGEYSVRKGYPQFRALSIPSNERANLAEIVQWGDIKWKDMSGFLYNAKDTWVIATDIADVSDVENYTDMLYNTDYANIDFSYWDFENAKRLDWMFGNAKGQTNDVKLYTPNVTNINYIAYNADNLKVLELDCTNVTEVNNNSFRSTSLERLILTNMSVSFTIDQAPSLLGSEIDNLGDSVKDMSGLSNVNIIVSNDQYFSMDTSIWSGKGWNIIT